MKYFIIYLKLSLSFTNCQIINTFLSFRHCNKGYIYEEFYKKHVPDCSSAPNKTAFSKTSKSLKYSQEIRDLFCLTCDACFKSKRTLISHQNNYNCTNAYTVSSKFCDPSDPFDLDMYFLRILIQFLLMIQFLLHQTTQIIFRN